VPRLCGLYPGICLIVPVQGCTLTLTFTLVVGLSTQTNHRGTFQEIRLIVHLIFKSIHLTYAVSCSQLRVTDTSDVEIHKATRNTARTTEIIFPNI
jgi:hypothetical protein